PEGRRADCQETPNPRFLLCGARTPSRSTGRGWGPCRRRRSRRTADDQKFGDGAALVALRVDVASRLDLDELETIVEPSNRLCVGVRLHDMDALFGQEGEETSQTLLIFDAEALARVGGEVARGVQGDVGRVEIDQIALPGLVDDGRKVGGGDVDELG